MNEKEGKHRTGHNYKVNRLVREFPNHVLRPAMEVSRVIHRAGLYEYGNFSTAHLNCRGKARDLLVDFFWLKAS
jgi:hypothetical protein